MRDWPQVPVVKLAILLLCLACVGTLGWRVFDQWRGPTPAKMDSHSTIPPVGWGRPQRLREAEPTGSPAPSDHR
jgi:hypothetical protein